MMARMLVNKIKTMHEPKPDCVIFVEAFCAVFISGYSQKLRLCLTVPSNRPQAIKKLFIKISPDAGSHKSIIFAYHVDPSVYDSTSFFLPLNVVICKITYTFTARIRIAYIDFRSLDVV